MKKLDTSKTIQLFVFAALAGVYIVRVLLNQEIGGSIATDPALRLMSILLWACLGLSFFFIFLDFSLYASQKKEYTSLRQAVHSDELSMIANRYGCDELIMKYNDTVLPDDFACMMFEMSNIQEINKTRGRSAGDAAIQDFAVMIRLAATDLCFIGRNGGNKFLALFETGGKAKSKIFLEQLDNALAEYSSDSRNATLTYACGYSVSDELPEREIHNLITLANRRIRDKEAMPV